MQRSLGAKPRVSCWDWWTPEALDQWDIWLFNFWIWLITQTVVQKRTLHKHWFAPVSERAARLVQMVRIHSWRTVRIQTFLGSVYQKKKKKNFWDGGGGDIDLNPACHGLAYFQRPDSCSSEFPFPAQISPPPSPNNTWDILSKAVSLPRSINIIYISVWEGMKK